MSKMSELDQAVQMAVEAIVSKRFRNIFARLNDLEKLIRSTNTRITQIKCRLGEMNAEKKYSMGQDRFENEAAIKSYFIDHKSHGEKIVVYGDRVLRDRILNFLNGEI